MVSTNDFRVWFSIGWARDDEFEDWLFLFCVIFGEFEVGWGILEDVFEITLDFYRWY